MVGVHLADSGYSLLIDIFQLTVQFFHIREVRSNRFVEKLITQNHRFIFITLRNLAPDVTIQLLAGFTFKQPGIAITVVNVISRLSARSIVHIKNQIKIGFTTPFHHTVHPGETILIGCQPHKVLICEQLIVKRQTDCIRTCILDELNIFTGDVIVLKRFPELSGKVGSHQLTEHLVDETGGIRLTELKHISFRIQPITQIGTHDKEFRTVGLYQILPLNCYKRGRFLCFFCLFTAAP